MNVDLTPKEIDFIINAIGWADGEGAYEGLSENVAPKTSVLVKLMNAKGER